MKRYIRLKEGKFIDTKRYRIDKHLVRFIRFFDDKLKKKDLEIDINDIVAESNNITDLIKVGDLYFYNINLTDRKVENQFDILDLTFDKDIMLAKLRAGQIELTKLFTRQGDNYILVWDKEREII